MALTEMLRGALYMEAECDAEIRAEDDTLNMIKGTFKDWLREVGLPDRFGIDKYGRGFNITTELRRLLITLVDEPGG